MKAPKSHYKFVQLIRALSVTQDHELMTKASIKDFFFQSNEAHNLAYLPPLDRQLQNSGDMELFPVDSSLDALFFANLESS